MTPDHLPRVHQLDQGLPKDERQQGLHLLLHPYPPLHPLRGVPTWPGGLWWQARPFTEDPGLHQVASGEIRHPPVQLPGHGRPPLLRGYVLLQVGVPAL